MDVFFIFFDFCSWIVKLSFFLCEHLSVPAAAFLLSQRTQINGGGKKNVLIWKKNRCLKRAFLKLPIGEFALLEVGQRRWKTIL